jgi:hypothetical protein
MTQYLSLGAILAGQEESAVSSLAETYRAWWFTARQLAEWKSSDADVEKKAWAHSSLAELELLGSIYNREQFDIDAARKIITGHCQDICDLSLEVFLPLLSTFRQFQRYVECWKRDEWDELARIAVNVLREKSNMADVLSRYDEFGSFSDERTG